MPVIQIRRGLDVPIHGEADASAIVDRLSAKATALLPHQEAPGLKARPLVEEGATVQVGTPLLCDRRDERVLFCSPAAGRVEAIHRGPRRVVLGIQIAVDDFDSMVDFPEINPLTADAETVREALRQSGFWPCLRQRPYDKVADSNESPSALFINGADSAPLAASPHTLIRGRENAFRAGLQVLRRLTEGPVHLCTGPGEDWSAFVVDGVQHTIFSGPHPSGLVGTHIHKLHPVGHKRKVWHIDAQSTADIGQLFLTRRIPTTRVVAVTGPAAKTPKLVRTRRGISMLELLEGEVEATEGRVVNGSPLAGPEASPGTPAGFLGRYANQVTVLEDAVGRDLLGWALPVAGRFTQTNTLFDKFFRKRFKFDTDTNGSLRAIVPIGQYESVMPLDILPTQLVKALLSHDLELAEQLGALELAEEDMALLEFVDNSKQPLTKMLRSMLETIEKES